MEKEKQETIPRILLTLASLLGIEVKNRRLEIPERAGKGYCSGFILNDHIRMIISNYELIEDIDIRNPEPDASRKKIFFKFQNIFSKTDTMPSVLIGTSRINTDEVISIHSNTATVNIEVDSGYLNEIFGRTEKSPVLQSLLQNTQPLLFDQLISPTLLKIVDEIITGPIDETFELYFLRIKAEELICRLLMELEKRGGKHLYPLNSRDIQTLYRIKEQMLAHLDTPPVIDDLALTAHMSPSKLKRLFKQIFGNSIFSYYQEFRMQEAARLLKEEKLSVSDTGYRLGFTNLSHFTRVFRQHTGMKPKQYSRS